MNNRKQKLTSSVENGRLMISIGVEMLPSYLVEVYGIEKEEFKINNLNGFAKDISCELNGFSIEEIENVLNFAIDEVLEDKKKKNIELIHE